jgi:calcineurin-like phosphoesterase family protein
MDQALKSNWNNVVKPEDTVYVIGDFALIRGANPDEKISKLEALTRSLNGTKHLIIGNHDKFESLEYICCGFDSVAYGFVEESIHNHLFVMCHYQMTSWNKSHFGSMHLFGHEHWKRQHEPKHSMYEEMHWSERKFNVCADANDFTPVNMLDIVNALEKRPTNFEK